MKRFVDSNVPMYLVGAPHPNRNLAIAELERAIEDGRTLVTNAEVLQEIVHRYRAIGRLDAIPAALDAVLGIVDEVYPIDTIDVLTASRLLTRVPALSSRDALHVATMQRYGVDEILTFDAGFTGVVGIRRLPA